MTGKPEILFLSHRIPYPPDKGDKIRSWRLFSHLCERFDVNLACFVDQERDFAHVDVLHSMAREAVFVRLTPAYARLRSLSALAADVPLSFRYFYNREMAAAVARLRERPLAAEVVFSSAMAPFVETTVPGRLRIVDFCDADSEKWRQYAQNSRGPYAWLYAREGRHLAAAETMIANWADASFAISEDEAEIFNKRAAIRTKVDWWPNGVDTDYFNPATPFADRVEPSDLVFTGAMDYRANVDAVMKFEGKVWPLVRGHAPDARLVIAGANPAPEIKAMHGREGIVVTGRVEDIRPWLAGAKIAIAPMLVARGVQNKVLEAMAMAKPVVATSAAAAGIPGAEQVIKIADDPAQQAQAIAALMDDAAQREAIGAAARAFVKAHFGWSAGLARFDRALEELNGEAEALSA